MFSDLKTMFLSLLRKMMEPSRIISAILSVLYLLFHEKIRYYLVEIDTGIIREGIAGKML